MQQEVVLKLQVFIYVLHTHKIPKLMLLHITNGDKQDNSNHVFVSATSAFQVFQFEADIR